MVCSFYPFLALLLAEGTVPSDCYRLPGDCRQAFELLRTAAGRKELSFAIGKPIGDVPWDEFEHQLDAIRAHEAGVVTFRDSRYPAYLRNIPKSPPILFYKGDLSCLDRRGVAIVGSRRASARGCSFASSLAGDLAGWKIMVASGAARGVDAAAHRGALARGGKTVGVVGTGLDISYPPEHAGLLGSIADRGCVLTEQLMGTPPRAFVFPLRNRLISAISRIIVVVEAGARSGALLTARWALEQGREVGAVPGFPGDYRSRGVNALLKMGAVPVETADDVLEAAPLLRPDPRETHPIAGRGAGSGPPARGLSEEARRVYDALGGNSADADTLAAHLDESVTVIQRILLDLEIGGLVARDPVGDYYRL